MVAFFWAVVCGQASPELGAGVGEARALLFSPILYLGILVCFFSVILLLGISVLVGPQAVFGHLALLFSLGRFWGCFVGQAFRSSL